MRNSSLKNFLWQNSGGGIEQIRASKSRQVRNYFLMVGTFMLLLFVCCIISSFYIVDTLFHNKLLAGIMSFVLAWIIYNIYLVLLTTLKPNVVSTRETPKSNQYSTLLSASYLVRMGFLLLFGLFISKPLEMILVSKKVDPLIQSYKEKLFREQNSKLNNIWLPELSKLRMEVLKSQNLHLSDSTHTQSLREKLAIEVARYNKDRSFIHSIIDKSEYFIVRLKNSAGFQETLILKLAVILLFLAPAVFKYLIAQNPDYQLAIIETERNLINNHYNHFKENYRGIFFKKFNLEITYYEAYQDPPFNTKKKVDSQPRHSEQEFLNRIYDTIP